MAEADKAVMDYLGRENLLYINVANRLSVDCDCDSHPKEPEMADLGIFASVDPVALDQACVDAVYRSPDPGKAALIERMESRNSIHTVETAAAHGLAAGTMSSFACEGDGGNEISDAGPDRPFWSTRLAWAARGFVGKSRQTVRSL